MRPENSSYTSHWTPKTVLWESVTHQSLINLDYQTETETMTQTQKDIFTHKSVRQKWKPKHKALNPLIRGLFKDDLLHT